MRHIPVLDSGSWHWVSQSRPAWLAWVAQPPGAYSLTSGIVTHEVPFFFKIIKNYDLISAAINDNAIENQQKC